MCKHDGTGVDQDGRSEDLGCTHVNGIDGATVDERCVCQPVLGVEGEDMELFLGEFIEGYEDLAHEEVGCNGRRLHSLTVVDRMDEAAQVRFSGIQVRKRAGCNDLL